MILTNITVRCVTVLCIITKKVLFYVDEMPYSLSAMSMNFFSNIIWTTVNSYKYVASNTFIFKHMIISRYKQVIFLLCVILVYFRSLGIRHIIKIFW